MVDIDYYDIEEAIPHFWNCSISKEWDKFNFEEAFEFIEDTLFRKLAEHGLLTFEDFEQFHEELGLCNKSELENFTQQTDYIQISEDDILKAINEYKFNRNKEAFEDYASFETLKKLYEKVKNRGNLEQKELIFLYDESIHAEHETSLLFDIDLTQMKEDYENKDNEV